MADDDFDLEPVVPRENKKKKKKGGALKVGLIVLLIMLGLIAAAAGGLWYFWLSEWYGSGDGGEVPIIRADSTPIKVKPKDPGGMAVPDRDKLVYQRMNGEQAGAGGVERLLPPAEAPLPAPTQSDEPLSAVPAPVTAAAPLPPSVPPVQPNGDTPVSLAPKPLTANPPPPTPAPKVAAPQPAAAPVAAPKPAPTVTAKPAPVPPKPRASSPKLKAEVSSPTLTTQAPARTVSAKAYKVQLGAVRSASAAQAEFKRLQTKHKDVLGPLVLSVVKADLGAKGIYYRLRAGPLASGDAAKAACEKLKARKVPCFPVAPGK